LSTDQIKVTTRVVYGDGQSHICGGARWWSYRHAQPEVALTDRATGS